MTADNPFQRPFMLLSIHVIAGAGKKDEAFALAKLDYLERCVIPTPYWLMTQPEGSQYTE